MTPDQKNKDLDAAKAALKRREHHSAAELFQRHADQGDAEAQYWLGAMYIDGPGVGRNFIEAVKWLRKAAEQGHAAAQMELGNRYEGGFGVEKDFPEAARWYRLAANQGFDMAQYLLGKLYYLGDGMKQDYAEAYFWYSLAARKESDVFYDVAASAAAEAAQGLTAEQISTVNRRLEEWRQAHPLPWPSMDDVIRPITTGM